MTTTSPSKPFRCWWCGDPFDNHEALRAHLKERQHKEVVVGGGQVMVVVK